MCVLAVLASSFNILESGDLICVLYLLSHIYNDKDLVFSWGFLFRYYHYVHLWNSSEYQFSSSICVWCIFVYWPQNTVSAHYPITCYLTNPISHRTLWQTAKSCRVLPSYRIYAYLVLLLRPIIQHLCLTFSGKVMNSTSCFGDRCMKLKVQV